MLRKTLSAVGFVMGFLAFLFCLIAVATVRWYVITTTTADVELGLRTMCVTDKTVGGGTRCEDIKLEVNHLTTCVRTEDEMTSRFRSVQGLTAFSVILIFVSFLLCAVQVMKSIFIVKLLIGVFAALSLLFIIIALAMFNHTLESWFFCDMNFCEYFKDFYVGQECDASLGFSCVFIILVLLCLIIQIVFSMLAVKEHKPDAPSKDGGHGPQGYKEGGKHSPSGGQSPRHGEDPDDHHNYAKEEPVGDDEEDWVLDEDTGYMWSESQQMYFDEESGHYFNPEYDQWYNPDTDEWYQA